MTIPFITYSPPSNLKKREIKTWVVRVASEGMLTRLTVLLMISPSAYLIVLAYLMFIDRTLMNITSDHNFFNWLWFSSSLIFWSWIHFLSLLKRAGILTKEKNKWFQTSNNAGKWNIIFSSFVYPVVYGLLYSFALGFTARV